MYWMMMLSLCRGLQATLSHPADWLGWWVPDVYNASVMRVLRIDHITAPDPRPTTSASRRQRHACGVARGLGGGRGLPRPRSTSVGAAVLRPHRLPVGSAPGPLVYQFQLTTSNRRHAHRSNFGVAREQRA